MMNRYLQDNFAPVHEELTAFDLEVTGAIPDHLDGRYLRIGPNPATDPGEGYHWFLGEGMVHGVRLEDGHAPVVPQPLRPPAAATTSRPTPTSSSTPGARSRSSRPARSRTS